MQDAIRTMLVHSHTLLRQGVTALLRCYEHVEVVCDSADPSEAVSAAELGRPHVAVLEMSGQPWVEACRRLSVAHPTLPLVLLGTSRDLKLISRAMRAGGTVYLPPDLALDDLVTALEQAGRHGRGAGPKVASPRTIDAPPLPITARERDVLALVAKGHANRKIGRALSISENTVRNHIASIFIKLGVKDRTEAAVQALRLGLL